MDYFSFCPSLRVNKEFQLGKRMLVFFPLILLTGTNRDQFCKRCSVSRFFGKVQNIDLMSEASKQWLFVNADWYMGRLMFQFFICLKRL